MGAVMLVCWQQLELEQSGEYGRNIWCCTDRYTSEIGFFFIVPWKTCLTQEDPT